MGAEKAKLEKLDLPRSASVLLWLSFALSDSMNASPDPELTSDERVSWKSSDAEGL